MLFLHYDNKRRKKRWTVASVYTVQCIKIIWVVPTIQESVALFCTIWKEKKETIKKLR